jgi:hypothetical protein
MTFIPGEFERVNRVENGNISGEKIRTVEITFYIRKYSFSKIFYNSTSWLSPLENSVHHYLATLLDGRYTIFTGQPLEKGSQNCGVNLTVLYSTFMYCTNIG